MLGLGKLFHPDTHPIYVTLLEELGFDDPERPDADATLEAAGSLGDIPGWPEVRPILSSSPRLLDAGKARVSTSATFNSQLARQAVLSNLPWEFTVEGWIRGLPRGASFKRDVLRPWITATIGCAWSDARRASARSILQTFALAFPANVLEGVSTYTSKIGLQGNLQRMLDRSPTARVHLGTPARALSRQRGGWFLRTPAGRKGPYRFVVLNAPPRVGRELLLPLPAFADVTALLEVYRSFDSRLLAHTDPAYMPRDRRTWGAYNAGVDGPDCEGSAWLGALQEEPAAGASVHVFKSWAQRRRADPKHVLLERRFEHPLITRSAIEAARALRPLQGRRGLYFSGQYTTGMDLQESALYSAMKVAESLAPGSRTLASLTTRLPGGGRACISYDL